MQRDENALHYQGFTLQPLCIIAELAQRQGVNLYAYTSHGRSLRDAIAFFGRAVADPSVIKPYTPEEQRTTFGPSDFAPFVFYLARFGSTGLPPNIPTGISPDARTNRIGGNLFLFAGR